MAKLQINNGLLIKCILDPGEIAVTIPDSVTSIGDEAFQECIGLTEVTIPNSVTSIGEWAFANCTGLTSVTIPNSVTSIGIYAFVRCVGLTEVTIPNSVTSIGNSAFVRCTGLTSVTIPDSVTSIGNHAFALCTGLTEVTIPNSVTSIGNYVFYNCTGLTSITILGNVTSISEGALGDCSGLKLLRIPGFIALSALQKSFWIFNCDNYAWVAPAVSKILPKPGFRLISEAVSINLSNKVATSGNIYAKRFCAFLLLIQNRIDGTSRTPQQHTPHDIFGNILPHMPIEMWIIIASFYYQEYFPKLDITTTQIGLDEDNLKGSYEKQEAALTSYNTAIDKLQHDWSTPVMRMK